MEGPPDPFVLPSVRERLPDGIAVPSPSRRQVIVVVLVGLVLTVGWVRLADPVALRGPTPTVDPADPPAEVTADAVERLQYVDYTYRLSTATGTGRVTEIDNTDRQRYSSFGNIRKRYAREGGAWARLGSDGWRSIEGGGFDPHDTSPFDADALRAADVTVLREDGDTLVVAVNDSATVGAILKQRLEGNSLVFHVDTASGTLERVRFRRVVGELSGWWEYSFYDYGETDVRRPSGVPARSFSELLADVVRD